MKFYLTPVILWAAVLGGGCQPHLEHQPKLKIYQETPFFSDGSSARPRVTDTVSRNDVDDETESEYEMRPTTTTLRRGRERFEIYCSVCHGLTGSGEGLAVKRGFQKPESLTGDAMRRKTTASYVEVMARGDGAMMSFSDRVDNKDQWAIAFYIRALQLSQNFDYVKLSADEKLKLGAAR